MHRDFTYIKQGPIRKNYAIHYNTGRADLIMSCLKKPKYMRERENSSTSFACIYWNVYLKLKVIKNSFNKSNHYYLEINYFVVVAPPSTTNSLPVANLDSSDAKNNTIYARSLGSPRCGGSGKLVSIVFLNSG